jgi:hypothetical protein
VAAADHLRERAAKLSALAVALREQRGSSVTAEELEQMGHQALAESQAIEQADGGGLGEPHEGEARAIWGLSEAGLHVRSEPRCWKL